jgi:hypothetical protein
MTAGEGLGSVDELTDGTGSSVDAAMGAANRSILKIPVGVDYPPHGSHEWGGRRGRAFMLTILNRY